MLYVNQSLLIAEIYQHSITSTTWTWLRPSHDPDVKSPGSILSFMCCMYLLCKFFRVNLLTTLVLSAVIFLAWYFGVKAVNNTESKGYHYGFILLYFFQVGFRKTLLSSYHGHYDHSFYYSGTSAYGTLFIHHLFYPPPHPLSTTTTSIHPPLSTTTPLYPPPPSSIHHHTLHPPPHPSSTTTPSIHHHPLYPPPHPLSTRTPSIHQQ